MGLPCNDEAAIREPGYRRDFLRARRGDIDQVLRAHTAAIGIEPLHDDAFLAAILVIGPPGNGEAAVLQRGDRGETLVARCCVGVGLGFSAQRGAVGVVALEMNIKVRPEPASAVRGRAVPCDHEAAVREFRHMGALLAACGSGINPERRAGQLTGRQAHRHALGGSGPRRGIGSCAADKGVGARAADERVVPGAAGKPVGRRIAGQVVAAARPDQILHSFESVAHRIAAGSPAGRKAHRHRQG